MNTTLSTPSHCFLYLALDFSPFYKTSSLNSVVFLSSPRGGAAQNKYVHCPFSICIVRASAFIFNAVMCVCVMLQIHERGKMNRKSTQKFDFRGKLSSL